jgi:hypothetical protein
MSQRPGVLIYFGSQKGIKDVAILLTLKKNLLI